MYQKQKVLAMERENSAEFDVIEIKGLAHYGMAGALK
jgi:hypothetical protein